MVDFLKGKRRSYQKKKIPESADKERNSLTQEKEVLLGTVQIKRQQE
jgi:hypothetical protein